MSIFFRTQRGRFYGRWNGKTYALEADRTASLRRFAEIKGEVIPEPKVQTLHDVLTIYLDGADLAPSTREVRTEVFARLRRYWDGPVTNLTPDVVRNWFKTRKVGRTSQATHIGNLKAALNWLVKQGVIESNPLKTMPKPRVDRRERFLTTEEVEIMLGMLREPFRSLVMLGLETGARCSELIALEARHVKGDHILFPKSEAKSRKSDRTIWLNATAREIVDQLRAKYPTGKLMRNSRGIAWTKDSVRQRMEPVAKKLGWPVRVTDLRHRFAVDRLTRGQEPLIVAKLLGHSNANMIYSVYGHFCQNKQLMTNAANF